MGFIIGTILLGEGAAPYLCGLGVAVLGAVISYVVVNGLSPAASVEAA